MIVLTEQQVRESLMAFERERLDDWRREILAAGWPPELVDQVARLTYEMSAAHVERALPLMWRDLEITASAASLH